MFHVVLHQPQIAPNTGNIIRLCANTGSRLHLIHPLGFTLDDRKLRRAGLDYHEWTRIVEHSSLEGFLTETHPARTFLFSTRGQARYDQVDYRRGDALVFGSETRGLPDTLLDGDTCGSVLRIPMLADLRSLNLSNAVAIVVYEAWRQLEYQHSV
jgi:tRNA (cytidine/uridine-2'-O-)-methyltransferase